MGILSFFRKFKEGKFDNFESDELREKEVIIREEYNSFNEESKEVIEEVIEEIKDVEISKEEVYTVIIREILNIVDLYDNFNEVRFAAREAAMKIGRNNLGEITRFLSKKIDRETKYITRYSEEEWNVVVENTILMIIYSYREDAIVVLEEISEKYSRLKLKSINLLCKLASEKVKTDEIINWVMNKFIDFNDKEKIVVLGFMSQVKGNNNVIGLTQYFYKDFVKSGQIDYAIKTLNHLINVAEQYTDGHLKFLKSIAMNKKNLKLSEIMKVEEGDPEFVNITNINENLSIEATIMYYKLDSEDKDIKSKLQYLSEYSLDENLRKDIKAILDN